MVPIAVKSNKIALIDFSGLNMINVRRGAKDYVNEKHDAHTLPAAIGREMWVWVPEKDNKIEHDKKS